MITKKVKVGVSESAEFVVNESPSRRYMRRKRSRMAEERLNAPQIGKFDMNAGRSQGRVKEPPLLLTGVSM